MSIVSAITGSLITCGGGGGGAGFNTRYVLGAGGAGGGGKGGVNGTYPTSAGTANTGGGGGGRSWNMRPTGGNGGSGVVIISYPTASASSNTCGGTTTTTGTNTVCTYTSSGTFTVARHVSTVTPINYLPALMTARFGTYTYASSTNSWIMYDKNGRNTFLEQPPKASRVPRRVRAMCTNGCLRKLPIRMETMCVMCTTKMAIRYTRTRSYIPAMVRPTVR